MSHDPSWVERLFAPLVARRLGGYRNLWNPERLDGPQRLFGESRVAVIGGGLAGIVAASTLAERGFSVDLIERNPYLGGKLGSWEDVTSDGSTHRVEHGFHAFFLNYHNLRGFLAKTGADQRMSRIADYQVLSRDGTEHSYRKVATTPLINLLSLWWHGFYDLWKVARNPKSIHLRAMLEYEEASTFARYDDVSFAEFARMAEVPDSLMLSFNTFARAFFASTDRLSTAELLKSFHFYYLSNDAGLLYDVPQDDHEHTLLAPFRAHLAAHGARLHLGTPVEGIERDGARFRVHGEVYDAVILACDPGGVRAIAGSSPWLADEAPNLAGDLAALRTAQGYAVLRLWLKGEVPWPHVSYLVTERVGALDAIAIVHQTEESSRAWLEREGESVVELHCYAIPDGLTTEAEVRDALVAGFLHYAPQAAPLPIVREHLQLKRDFTAFHVGMAKRRPRVTTSVDGLYLAGDWVKLPFPAMLMEAAATSGLLAANAVLASRGMAEEPVWHVPLRGLLAPRRAAITGKDGGNR